MEEKIKRCSGLRRRGRRTSKRDIKKEDEIERDVLCKENIRELKEMKTENKEMGNNHR